MNRGYRQLVVWTDAIGYSGLHACRRAGQITEQQFEEADALAYKIENGLVRLIARLQEKEQAGDWEDTFVVRESNEAYASAQEKP